MALIFSHITLRTDYGEHQFFAGGIPKDTHDLEPYTAYHEFVEEITEDTSISATERGRIMEIYDVFISCCRSDGETLAFWGAV